MASDRPVFPIQAIRTPLDHEYQIKAVINTFGQGQEQRILPGGLDTSLSRDDGTGTLAVFPVWRTWSISIRNIVFRSDPFSGNALLDDSLEKLLEFYHNLFYDSTNNKVRFLSFYWYDPGINDDRSTWLGSDSASGTNSLGETVYNTTGRFTVRFADGMISFSRMQRCLTSVDGLQVIEVAD